MLRIADVNFNVKNIIGAMEKAQDEKVQVLFFPEMAVTGYTIGDLVQHKVLLSKVEKGLHYIMEASSKSSMVIIIGTPLCIDQRIFNCAAVFSKGQIIGIVPKTLIPNYKEFYEERWFASGGDSHSETIEFMGKQVPFGTDILFKLRGYVSAIIGIEICEDLWSPLAPHEYQALSGATVLINLSASNEILGKSEWRRVMAASESGRCIAAYCYASSGIGESSNDVVFGGHVIITENGAILCENKKITSTLTLAISDLDIERLEHDRRVFTSFHDAGGQKCFRIIETDVTDASPGRIQRKIYPHPFVPDDPAMRATRCCEILSMQTGALAKKLTGARKEHVVLGVSGGLDSTLALLVAVKAMDFLGFSRMNVHAFSLPGFGTTRRTRINASRVCKALGVNVEEVNIIRTCTSHLKDIRHSGQEDVIFENVQARYRTEFLFNKANDYNGIVLGTGDLTEIALGWCTFSGDHISHYHINASVPKTLVRYLIQWVAEEEMAHSPARKALFDILETPISPELRRPEGDTIIQKSEEVIGPIELADFYLYPFLRYGMRPGKILYLAEEARKQGLFDGQYNFQDLYIWLRSFLERFFVSQFKRTCMPEGPKIGSASLSPRGDWRMPSDAEAVVWLEDLEEMYSKIKSLS